MLRPYNPSYELGCHEVGLVGQAQHHHQDSASGDGDHSFRPAKADVRVLLF